MRFVSSIVVVAAGCGGGGSGGFVVDVEAPGAALVVVQDGDGPFETLALDAQGAGSFTVSSGFYGVGRVCADDAGGFRRQRTQINFETEPRTHRLPCTVPEANVRLSGTTAPDAEVWVGQFVPATPDATGAYETLVVPGTYDVFALVPGATPRLLARHGTALATDQVVDLPVVAEGFDLATLTPTVTGADPTTVMLYADINTASSYVFLDTAMTTVHVPPAAALDAADHPSVGASAGGCNDQKVLAPEISLRIPSPLAATVDRSLASFTVDPSVVWDNTRLSLRNSLGSEDSQSVTYFPSPSWRAVAGVGDTFPIVDVSTLPGWTADLGGFATGDTVRFDLSVSRGRYDGDLTGCSVSGTFTW